MDELLKIKHELTKERDEKLSEIVKQKLQQSQSYLCSLVTLQKHRRYRA